MQKLNWASKEAAFRAHDFISAKLTQHTLTNFKYQDQEFIHMPEYINNEICITAKICQDL